MKGQSISITTKSDEGIVLVTQLSIENKTLYVAKEDRLIYNGDIQGFKSKVATEKNKVLVGVYGDLLSLAEEVIDVLSKK